MNNLNGELYDVPESDREDDLGSEGVGENLMEHYTYKIIASHKSQNFLCNMNEIHFETQNLDNPNPGYYLRLETLTEKQSGASKIKKETKQIAF